MRPKGKTPAAVGAASGGDGGVPVGTGHLHSPDPVPPKALSIADRTRWLDQVLEDPEVGNAAFVAAYAVSAALLRDGDRPRTSLATLSAAVGRVGGKGDTSKNVRDGLLRLVARGHLHMVSRRGAGHFTRYTLIFKGPPTRQSPPLDAEPRISLERLPGLLAALHDVVRAARAAGLPVD